MNIGDKVRVLRGKEEGIITRIIDNKLIEIEIEDGFQIPVLKSEVVVVAKEENTFFKPEAASPTREKSSRQIFTPSQQAPEGIFLAFRPLNDRIMAAYLINQGRQQIPYTVFQESRGGVITGLACGTLNEGAFSKLAEISIQNFEEWPAYLFQFLFFSAGKNKEIKMPLTKKLNFKAASFYKSKRVAPVLNAEAYTFRLDSEASTVNADQLREKLNESGLQASSQATAGETPPSLLDLHIEKLSPHAPDLSSQEIISLQLSTFEKHLDQAIAAGLDEVVYIHGVGNGTLRNALHRRLSKDPNISYFKDAQKNKFGFGATQVKIK